MKGVIRSLLFVFGKQPHKGIVNYRNDDLYIFMKHERRGVLHLRSYKFSNCLIWNDEGIPVFLTQFISTRGKQQNYLAI